MYWPFGYSFTGSSSPWATTEPLSARMDVVSPKTPVTAFSVSPAVKIPMLSTAKANTEATTTKAISMIDVSRPVMPRSSLHRPLILRNSGFRIDIGLLSYRHYTHAA